jgi:hypothetical protein
VLKYSRATELNDVADNERFEAWRGYQLRISIFLLLT